MHPNPDIKVVASRGMDMPDLYPMYEPMIGATPQKNQVILFGFTLPINISFIYKEIEIRAIGIVI